MTLNDLKISYHPYKSSKNVKLYHVMMFMTKYNVHDLYALAFIEVISQIVCTHLQLTKYYCNNIHCTILRLTIYKMLAKRMGKKIAGKINFCNRNDRLNADISYLHTG